ncbi:MAG: hypothetical protein DIJKHBIC_02503 [Thermoanaerobaculia bacterium]|nr:hypothetical protein [Thermoanaerobaculia bacterium]
MRPRNAISALLLVVACTFAQPLHASPTEYDFPPLDCVDWPEYCATDPGSPPAPCNRLGCWICTEIRPEYGGDGLDHCVSAPFWNGACNCSEGYVFGEDGERRWKCDANQGRWGVCTYN